MRSLFEEQIEAEIRALAHHVESPAESYAEATSYFPNFSEYQLAPDQYLRQIEALKKALSIPVIASLNGARLGRLDRLRAGASSRRAPTRSSSTSTSSCPAPASSAAEVEADLLEIVHRVCRLGADPGRGQDLAIPHLAREFREGAGARRRRRRASSSTGSTSPTSTWTSWRCCRSCGSPTPPSSSCACAGSRSSRRRCACPSAASGGVHSSEDALKALFAGAHAVQVVSVLLQNGPRFISASWTGCAAGWASTGTRASTSSAAP